MADMNSHVPAALACILGVACLLTAAPAAPAPRVSAAVNKQSDIVARVGDLAFRECQLSNAGRSRAVQCARMVVPEDYTNPDSRSLSIRIVRLDARNGSGAGTPLLAIAGGPGQAASEAFLNLDHMFPDVARYRDFYLVDQRGTGGSNPQHCDLDDEALMQVESDMGQIRQSARECLANFDGDPTLYTTSIAIRDLERVREALGVPRWHLFGVSYGTRVVQHYLRRHPQVIRTAVLDSVVPATEALGPDIALRSQQALDTLLDRCETNTACNKAFPDLARGLNSLLTGLGDAPRELVYEDPRTGGLDGMRFTRAHLVGVLRLSLYQSEQLSILPPMLHQAYANDNFTALARTADAIVKQMAGTLAIGMHNSVVCTEDVPFFAIDGPQREALSETYMGDLVVRGLEVTCDEWPVGVMDEDFRSPVTADVPVLLLSGEADPITPPAYAEAVLAHLPRGRHLVARGQGHFVSPRGCLPRLVAQFISSDGDAEPAAECLDRLQAAPLFVNANGPTP